MPKLWLLCVLLPGLILAQPDATSRYQLSIEKQQHLNQVISEGLAQAHQQETSLEKKLREQETEIGKRLAAIYDLDIALVKTAAKQDAIVNQLAQLAQQTGLHRVILAEQVRFAYLSGSTQLAPSIFSEHPKRAQVTAWYRYLLAKRSQTLQALANQKAKQEALEKTLLAEQQALAVQRKERQAAWQAFTDKRQEDKQKLRALREQIHTDQAQLLLGENELKNLAQILSRLKASNDKTPMVPVVVRPFAKQKGQLPPPIIQVRMSPLPQSKAVVYRAAQGSLVQVIADGRVVFADWMRGYGLLAIVDHGDGYMSLYGRNQALFKSRGEWVRAGEPLAKVGETGGLAGSGLFFELRRNGKPLALGRWLKRARG